jgi:spore coat polysaccharide biosynthesis predicted glycosyltransferase SpsG
VSRPRVTFLCRGSTDVGLGHVMRSRTVADALAATGRAVVRFVAIGDDAVDALLRDRPYPVLVTADDAEAAAMVRATQPHVAAFDLTKFAPADFRRAATAARTVSLSPVFDRLPEIQTLFHRAARHPLGPRPGWRLGPRWAVVRPGCSPIPEPGYLESIAPDRPLPVAVCMGGGDAANATRDVLERLRGIDRPLLIWALLGEGYRHSFDELERTVRADRRHEIILARTTNSMWQVLRGCAVAILAGGTVTYEAAAAGLPSINLLHDPDHAYLIDDLTAAGAAFAARPDSLAPLIARFDADRPQLLAAHRAARGLVDGRAAERIAGTLIDLARGTRTGHAAGHAAPRSLPHATVEATGSAVDVGAAA